MTFILSSLCFIASLAWDTRDMNPDGFPPELETYGFPLTAASGVTLAAELS